ncbi:CTD kinase subunit gamma CTK3-domain-containing protein [Gymnopilus junonius]|uniref:CTD kinase subunit gamma CTK3-domain-containing protein n=1 Tax=Gymnopilus junonius TaxID=109634 RepID=A0A9P5TUN0_GYMJU|nr:CTD kinase subunit gamma CTK3-domain-containing protein [Gymnopilus junonius]
MDPFEVRMQCIDILRKLNASQQSISKLVTFAIKYFPPCGEDIWDCIVEETQKGSVNSRINILYFLDSLCEACLKVKSQSKSERSRVANANGLYVQFISRDLNRIVGWIVPEGRQGLPNVSSTKQILQNWRSKRYIEPQKIEEVLSSLDSRPQLASSAAQDSLTPSSTPAPPTAEEKALSRHEVNKRIEQDRERHKRLRERRWVQPTSYNASFVNSQLASFYPLTGSAPAPPPATPSTGTEESAGNLQHQEELPLDIEFENEWETTSDFNEDDEEAIKEEALLAFPDTWNDEGSIVTINVCVPWEVLYLLFNARRRSL